MRAKFMVISLFVLTLAGSGVLAGTCAIHAQGTCPSSCPNTYPTAAPACPATGPVCPPPCPPAQQVIARPADVGAGPAPDFGNLCGTEFDQAYLRLMYQQYSDVSTVAAQGLQLSTDRTIRELSSKIRDENTKFNQNVVAWWPQFCNGVLAFNYSRAQCVLDTLQAQCGLSFEMAYAQTMACLLQQSRDAAIMGEAKSTRPEIREQAAITRRSADNEIKAFQQWGGDLARKHPGVATICAPASTTCPIVPSNPIPAAPICPPGTLGTTTTPAPAPGAGPAVQPSTPAAPVVPMPPAVPSAPAAPATPPTY